MAWFGGRGVSSSVARFDRRGVSSTAARVDRQAVSAWAGVAAKADQDCTNGPDGSRTTERPHVLRRSGLHLYIIG